MCGGRRSFMFGFGGCGTGHYEQPYEPYSRSYASERLRDREFFQGEIRKLYAEGAIERGQYYDALDRLNQGIFTLDNLADLREGNPPKTLNTIKVQKERTPVRESSEMSKLTSKKAEIEKAKEQISSLINELRQNNNQLKNQMTLEEKLAEGTISTDEQKAREHLLSKQDLLEQASHIEVRIKELESDLKQLEGLEIKTEAKILQQKAVSQREKLMSLTEELG